MSSENLYHQLTAKLSQLQYPAVALAGIASLPALEGTDLTNFRDAIDMLAKLGLLTLVAFAIFGVGYVKGAMDETKEQQENAPQPARPSRTASASPHQSESTLLLRHTVTGQLDKGRYLDPETHSSLSPAVTINVDSPRLEGVELPLVFEVYSPDKDRSLKKRRPLASLPVTHTLTAGDNLIFSRQSLKAANLKPGRYTFAVTIPGGVRYQKTDFTVGHLARDLDLEIGTDGVAKYNPDAHVDGLGLQDLINIISSDSSQ